MLGSLSSKVKLELLVRAFGVDLVNGAGFPFLPILTPLMVLKRAFLRKILGVSAIMLIRCIVI